MKTILFDETCTGWTKFVDANVLYLGLQRDYLNDLLIARGYVYLNDIYESLGAKWNPDDENICYRSENGPIVITFEPAGKGNHLVIIH